MNKVFLIGRLARDPELRHTSNGTGVCQITVAISRRVAQGANPETDFINVTVWDKQAEKKVYVTEVVASNVEFLGSGNSNNQPTVEENPFDNQPAVDTADVSDDPFANFGEKIDISDNDLPF